MGVRADLFVVASPDVFFLSFKSQRWLRCVGNSVSISMLVVVTVGCRLRFCHPDVFSGEQVFISFYS